MFTVAPPPEIATARPASRRLRLVRAYAAALRVALSYLAFEAAAWIRGGAWAQRARPRLHKRNGRRVRRAILKLRGLFIKAGQLASILTNFLPEPFRAELEGLQDQVPAGPVEGVRARIQAELGDVPEALFAEFDDRPLASASLAQVHRARLADGTPVAVKVQHADIEAIARLDLKAIETILRVVGRWFGIGGLREQFRQIEAVILEELDFEQEAAHLAAVAAQFEAPEALEGVAFPRTVPERSARRVLTTTFVHGVKAGNLAGLDAAGIDRTALAERIVRAYGQMIFRDGRYHADPHPGNLIARPDGELVFIDFGAVASLTPPMRRGLAEMLAGTLDRDAARVTAALGTMGFVRTGADADTAVVTLIERIHEGVLGGLDPDAFRFADVGLAMSLDAQAAAFGAMSDLGVSLRDLTEAFQVPKDWILLERTVILLLGLCTALAPDLNPLKILWPYVEPLVAPSAEAGQRILGDSARGLAKTALELPRRAARVLALIERGEATVQVEGLARHTQAVYAGFRQLVYTIGAVGSGGVAYAAHAGGDAGIATALAAVSGACVLALVGSALKVRRGA